jgi:hypothetical protein
VYHPRAIAHRTELMGRRLAATLAVAVAGYSRLPGETSKSITSSHIAGYNLGLVMRQLIGAGTPKELAARGAALPGLRHAHVGLLGLLILPRAAAPEPNPSTGC